MDNLIRAKRYSCQCNSVLYRIARLCKLLRCLIAELIEAENHSGWCWILTRRVLKGMCMSSTLLNKQYHCSSALLGSLNISNVFQGTRSKADRKLSIEMFLVKRKVIVLWPGTLDLIELDFHETKTGRWSLSDSDRVPDFKTLVNIWSKRDPEIGLVATDKSCS